MRRYSKIFGRIRSDRSGSTALVAAFALPCLIGMVGGGIDYARYVTVRQSAQDASDQSVIELATYILRNRLSTISEEKRDQIASRLFKDHLGPEVKTRFDVSTTRNGETATTTLKATSTVPTYFLSVVGMKDFEVVVSSKAKFDFKTYAVEFAFVINSSSSMNTSRKKTALDKALTTVFSKFEETNKASKDRVRVAMVPFQLGVSVPQTDNNIFSLLNLLLPASNCVVDRSAPYSYNNNPVLSLLPLTKYPLASADDAPSTCVTSPVLPLTTDLAAAREAAPVISNSPGTNGAIGLAWGWNMLTPGAPLSKSGTIPLSKDQTSLRRVLIYMTDGENTGNSRGNPATTVDDWSLKICSGMKAAQIEVITINIDGSGSELFLQACASTGKYKKVPANALPRILDDMVEDSTGYAPIRLVE